jgi:CHAT domain-containing protein
LFLICQRNQAMALRAQWQPAAALAMLAAIEQPVLAMGDQLEHAEVVLERARILHQLGESTAALDCLHAARALFLTLGNMVAAAECLLDQGWLHLDLRQLSEAITCLRGALPSLAERPAHSWRALHGLGRIAEQQGDTATALVHYDAASAMIAGLRRKLASEHASSDIFAQVSQLYQDALRLAARGRDVARLLALVEQQRALVLQRQIVDSTAPPPPELLARRERLRVRLRELLAAGAPTEQIDAALQEYVDALLHTRHHTVPAAEAPHEPFDLALARQRLVAMYGSDWTVLAPIIVGDQLLLVTLTADDLTLTSTPYDALLRALIERACLPRYRMATYRNLAHARGQAATAWAPLRALADRLLPAPLRARLHPDHRLLVAPCGPLHALPWAALRVGDAWLAELAVIQQITALALAPARARPPGSGSRALLVGCATFGERAPDLPGALESLDLVQARWPGTVTRLESAQATRQALIELAARGELGQYELIHIASHAQFGATRGLLGHIKLADDDLLIDEVLRLDLRGALVVLAACESAASEVLPDDEVLGISRALLAAGAASVVASLWPIYDLAAPQMLDKFYRGLVGGEDAALALVRAQRELLALPDAGNPHAAILRSPFVWANFCVTSVEMAREPWAGGSRPAAG